MKKLLSTLLFCGFLILCGWEVVPKFYESATRETVKPLFVASTKKHGPAEKSDAVTKPREIDYQRLTRDINTDGA